MNHVVCVWLDYSHQPSKSFAGEINFFMYVQVGTKELVLACCNLRPIETMGLTYRLDSGGARTLHPKNFYKAKKNGRVIENVIIPVDELDTKFGVITEKNETFYYNFDGRVRLH